LKSITLTDCIGKILEKIINNRLVDGAKRNKIMDGETGAHGNLYIQFFYKSTDRNRVQTDKLHHADLRAAIGYRIIILSNIMNIEAGIMDMESRAEFIAEKYITKKRLGPKVKIIDLIKKLN
jgi:hypothetical protein